MVSGGYVTFFAKNALFWTFRKILKNGKNWGYFSSVFIKAMSFNKRAKLSYKNPRC
jgi:hypothetical protein